MPLGALAMASGSADKKNTYVFEVTPRGVGESASKSLAYWSTANGDDTMVTLWNPADEAQAFVFTLFFTGGEYKYPIELGARATRTLNVSEIIHAGIPDADGNIIPAGVSEGSVEIAGSLGENQHILVVVDAGVYNVRKATCGTVCVTCNGVTSGAMTPSTFSFGPPGTTLQETFYAVWNTGSEYDITSHSSWYSSLNNGSPGNSIATVNNSGLVTAVGGGSVEISATDSNQEIEYIASFCAPIGVSCPTPPAAEIQPNGFASGTVYDTTPVISGINPGNWDAGALTQVTFAGQHFGTNAPTLTFSPSSGISYSLTSYNDTQIVANVTVAASTPAESVSITVTNNGYDGNPFQSSGGSDSPQSSPSTANVVALTLPAPRILRNGADITGQTISVVAGEQIVLTSSYALPAGVSVSSQTWSVPGPTVGGFDHQLSTGEVQPTDFTVSPTTFYWVNAGGSGSAKHTVTYSYIANNGASSPTATTAFSVSGPSAANVTVTTNPTEISLLTAYGTPNTPFVTFGALAGTVPNSIFCGPCGMNFTAAATLPPSNSGGYKWAQLVTGSVLKYTTGGTTKSCPPGPTGLDNDYPYDTGNTTTDAPGTQLKLINSEETVIDKFKMYLLWNANLPNNTSIDVPLGFVIWQWTGDATQTNGVWSVDTANSSGGPTMTQAFTAANGAGAYPTWSKIVTNGTQPCN